MPSKIKLSKAERRRIKVEKASQREANNYLSRQEREDKANQVRLQLAVLDLQKFSQHVKRINIILDLWVQHNRPHQEKIDFPISERQMEIKLYETRFPESTIIFRYIPKHIPVFSNYD